MLINEISTNTILVQIPRKWGTSYYLCTTVYREVDDQYAGTDDAKWEFSHLDISFSVGQIALQKMWGENSLTEAIPSWEFKKVFDEAIRQIL